MRTFTRIVPALLLVLAACGEETDPDIDAGAVGPDGGATDAAAEDGGRDDAGGADAATDAEVTDDAGGGDDGGGSCAGVECADYAAALSASPRGATSLANCVVQLHQLDCCGAMAAYGVNHAARDTLCPAEDACVATYPTEPGCGDATLTTDTGETTADMSEVRLRIVDPTPCSFDPSATCYTCETFVCTTGSCRSAPGIAGGCG